MLKRIAIVFAMLLPVVLFAQQKEITGQVYSAKDDMTLPGVTVVVEGSTRGTITDAKGNFSIQASEGEVLKFSFVGMETVEKTINAETDLTIIMEQSAEMLEEVTVSVGYFNVRKKDLTGSISQVRAETMEKRRTSSVEEMIQGRVAGVVVNESAEPGGSVGISIRGQNSMLGGTQPLYVVDGVPVDAMQDAQGNNNSGQANSSLSFLNPNDIESIEVLKDAAATSIYGARGANGVIVITTKGAEKGEIRDQVNVVADFSVSEINNMPNVLTGPQFEEYMNRRSLNQLYINITNPSREGTVFNPNDPIAINPTTFPDAFDNFELPFEESTGVNTDWQDEIFRHSLSKSLYVSYRGGSNKTSYAFSTNLSDNRGVIAETNFKRAHLKADVVRKAFDNKITFYYKVRGNYAQGKASSVGNGQMFQDRSVVSNALRFQPIYELLDPGQSDAYYSDLNEGKLLSNPYTLATLVEDQKQGVAFHNRLAAVAKVARHLTFSAKGAVNFKRNYRDNYYPTNTTRGRRNNGEATQAFIENTSFYSEGNLRYKNRIKGHRINAILLGTYEYNKFRNLFNKAYGFGSDLTSYYTFESATDILVPQANFSESALLSGLIRGQYNYKDKYYINANARVDASSKFAENNKSAFFPSIGIAWRPTEEPFLKNVDMLSNLKLRMSYGRTGSNPINTYQSLALLEPIRYNFNDELVTGYFEENLENANLTWETTDQYNVGLDVSLFKSKVNFIAEAYYKKTYDLLQFVALPASNGYATKVDNFGSVENKGLEFTLGIDLLRNPGQDIFWKMNGTFSFNRNKLLSLNSDLTYQLGPTIGYSKAYPIMFMEGKPLGVFWGAETDGVYDTWEEANNSNIEGAAPGEIKYVNHHVDVDENGDPLDMQQITFEDFVQIGDPNPNFTASISTSLDYKDWDFSILVTGQQGGDLFWVDTWPLKAMSKSTNVLTNAYNNSWIAPIRYDAESGEYLYDQSVANIEGATQPAPATNTGNRTIESDRQVYDASFIRLKNINIGYTIPFSQKGHSLRVFVSASNLFTITNYPGFDPEVMTYNKNPQRRGIDFGGYPGARIYNLGVKYNL